MKNLWKAALSVLLAVGTCGCAQNSAPQASEAEKDSGKEEAGIPEEETIDDPSWDTLESLGMVETENGLFYVTITLPANLVGEDITQEKLDAAAGESYTSGKLNDDGSVTYRMTKKQHRAMLEGLSGSIEDSLKELTESGDYAVSGITHNADFTSFDVTLTTDEVGFAEGFIGLGLFMFGGMYSIFTGRQSDIIVNYYSPDGRLIDTANSKNLGN